MVTDLQKYKEERLIPFHEQRRYGIPEFERVYMEDDNWIGETADGNRVLIRKEDKHGLQRKAWK